MKKYLCVILSVVLLLSGSYRVFADDGEDTVQHTDSEEMLFSYLQDYNWKLLVRRKNYSYMQFVEKFRSSADSLYFMNMVDFFIDSGAEPDKTKYMEVLLNIIATYEMDNAAEIAEQKNRDNLKNFKDYAMDAAEMTNQAISVMVGNSTVAVEYETELSVAIDCLGIAIKENDRWIEYVSYLETLVQDYSSYDSFLTLIVDNSDGELKEAAQELRDGMDRYMELKLNAYCEISDANFQDYTEFFFEDVFFDGIKQTPDYKNDSSVKFITDQGEAFVSKVSLLKNSWNLGEKIGVLVGNIAVGGENLINRTLEMMALYDISLILQDGVLETGNEFLLKYGKEQALSEKEKYIAYSQFLVGCRIRGEYCFYSTIVHDSGLQSWFNKDTVKETEQWYQDKAAKIMEIQAKIDRLSCDTNTGSLSSDGIDYEYITTSEATYTSNGDEAIVCTSVYPYFYDEDEAVQELNAITEQLEKPDWSQEMIDLNYQESISPLLIDINLEVIYNDNGYVSINKYSSWKWSTGETAVPTYVVSYLYGIKEGRELKCRDVLNGDETKIKETLLKYATNPEEYQMLLGDGTNLDDMLYLCLSEDGLHVAYRTTGTFCEAIIPANAPELKISW